MIQIGNRYLRRKYGDRHYSTLRKEEWDELKEYGIVNGYGPSSQPILRWILARIAPAFRRAHVEIHDFTCFQGGDELDRLKNDLGFYKRLRLDSINQGWLMGYYLGLSVVYFYAVRLLGKPYFQYK